MAKNKGINPVAAGVAGAVVGAAVGVAAVELNRKKIQKKVGQYKKKGEKAYKQLKKTVKGVSKKV